MGVQINPDKDYRGNHTCEFSRLLNATDVSRMAKQDITRAAEFFPADCESGQCCDMLLKRLEQPDTPERLMPGCRRKAPVKTGVWQK